MLDKLQQKADLFKKILEDFKTYNDHEPSHQDIIDAIDIGLKTISEEIALAKEIRRELVKEAGKEKPKRLKVAKANRIESHATIQ